MPGAGVVVAAAGAVVAAAGVPSGVPAGGTAEVVAGAAAGAGAVAGAAVGGGAVLKRARNGKNGVTSNGIFSDGEFRDTGLVLISSRRLLQGSTFTRPPSGNAAT